MAWSRSFADPILLKDGRVLATLSDAGALILAQPERAQSRLHRQ